MIAAIRRLFGTLPRFDARTTILTIGSVILPLVVTYFRVTPWVDLDRLIFYFLVPAAITLVFFRQPLRDYGMRLGDWKAGLILTLIGIGIMTPILSWMGQSDPVTRNYYRFMLSAWLPLDVAVGMFGWEFLFRGWLLNGYQRKFGDHAIWLQAVPFALMHLNKPPIETFSTIFGGFAFGWIAWRTRSFFYPFLIHWYIQVVIIIFAAT
jgi:membrane protease YdiL (CAAX protease family)